MSVVYWLHLPEHNLHEGYIGVTSQCPEKRLYEHFYCAKNGIHRNKRLINVLNKYSDQIKFSILIEGNEEYCYQIEQKLRPTPRIGWNLNAGGYISGFKKGVVHPPRSKRYREQSRQHFIENNPMHDPIYKVKQAEKRARDWFVIHPDGKEEKIHNLAAFARLHGLRCGTLMTAIKRGHKVRGYIVKRIAND